MTETNLTADLALSQKAKEFYNQGNHEAVVHLLKDHVERAGLDPWIYALFGYSVFKLTGKQYKDIVVQSLELAIKAKPDQAEFYYFFAVAVRSFINHRRSLEFFETAIRLNPKIFVLYIELAFTYSFLGQVEDMLATLKRGINATKSNELLGIFLQFAYYDTSSSMQDLHNYAKQFYQNYLQKYSPKPYTYDSNRYDKNKSHLKIGFFSCNSLTDWAGARGLCKFLDKNKFSIYGYAKIPASHELPGYCKDINASYVDEIVSNCVKWENYADLSLEGIAEKIYQDEIDILIDLAGTAAYDFRQEPFIGLAARKPAPVIATWLAASGSTGVKEMDYFITSKYQVLDGDEKFYTETICKLNSGLFQIQLDEVMELPKIKEAPCLANSYITFGSFHRYLKFTNRVYEVWAAILKKVPDSKLILKYADLDNPIVSEGVKERFENLGVSKDRIVTEGGDTKFNFQDAYNRIDIALDPFPFSGGTTTTDLLYMGVPVITNMSDRTSSRVCAGMLMANGYSELVANSEQEYIEKAVELANNKDRIVHYKSTLRNNIINGATSAQNFADSFAQALTWMWERSCSK